jgi:hypothetical protein
MSKQENSFNKLRFDDKADTEEIYMNTTLYATLEGQKDGGNYTLLFKMGNQTMTLNAHFRTVQRNHV